MSFKKSVKKQLSPKLSLKNAKLAANRFPIEIVFGIPLILMPQRRSLSRTHHSASHSPDAVIEDLT